MPKQPSLLRALCLFVLVFLTLCLVLYPATKSAVCPGQYVLYATLNHDESQLLVVTLPQCPFG